MRAGLARSDRRSWLAAWLVGLMLAVSAAPCTGFAAPLGHAAVSAPGDPCRSHAPAPALACAQAACQAAARAPEAPALRPPPALPLSYAAVADLRAGRRDPPPDPPPRL